MTTVLLVHGGLWEDMTADRFWHRPGRSGWARRRTRDRRRAADRPDPRGATDAELAGITASVGFVPSVPDDAAHQRHTVDALRQVLPQAVELPGCPEPPRPGFPPHAEAFVRTVARFARA